VGEGDGGSPILNVIVNKPRGGVKINKPKSIFNRNPNMVGVAIFEENVARHFVLAMT
jgi:hypothetical protein